MFVALRKFKKQNKNKRVEKMEDDGEEDDDEEEIAAADFEGFIVEFCVVVPIQ